jgi:hypothetical protein
MFAIIKRGLRSLANKGGGKAHPLLKLKHRAPRCEARGGAGMFLM